MIVTSSWTRGLTQTDGTYLVTERHAADDGETFQFLYTADDTIDPDVVMADRVAILNAQIAARDAVRAVLYGTTLPLTVYEFLKRFTTEERIAIRTAAQTNPTVEDFMSLLFNSGAVYQSNPDVQAALDYLVGQALLTSERAVLIGAV